MTTPPAKMSQLFGGNPDAGFLGLPRTVVGDAGKAEMVIVGAPGATPYASVGHYCADAPDAIRSALGWPGILEHHDFDLGGKVMPEGTRAVDWGNLPCEEQEFSLNRERITDCIGSILEQGAVPLVLGGDDSVPIPVLQAYREHGPLTVLQLDAHIDWRDEVQGETLGLSSNMRRASGMSWVENIIQVGARGLGSARPADYQDALDQGVQFFPMRDVAHHGLSMVTAAIPRDCNLYIALDIDVMDPAVVPGVIGPAPGGFSYRELYTLLEGAAGRARISGFNLVEFMPAADVGNRGALVAARTLTTVMGLVSRQRT